MAGREGGDEMALELYESLCDLCKHSRGLACAAYPDRIPLEIRLMHVDHREPYAGDHGIQFAPKDDSDETHLRLQEVRLRPGRVPAGTNDLDRRIGRVCERIAFADVRQKYRFTRIVGAADRFEELPEWCRTLVLQAEASEPAEPNEDDAPPQGAVTPKQNIA